MPSTAEYARSSSSADGQPWLFAARRAALRVVIPAVLMVFPASSAAGGGENFAEAGQLFIQNYSVEDYEAYAQNFSIVQSSDDLLYVANAAGVLEHDGVTWRKIPISNSSVARALTIGPEGRIFVGAVDELGYLAPDASGSMAYVSLMDQITDPRDRELGHIWSVASTSQGAYFQAYERLIRWDGEKMMVWRTDTRFLAGFVVGEYLYIHQQGQGMMRVEGDDLVPAPGGAFFRDKTSEAAVALDEQTFLVVTAEHGLFRCRTRSCSKQYNLYFNVKIYESGTKILLIKLIMKK